MINWLSKLIHSLLITRLIHWLSVAVTSLLLMIYRWEDQIKNIILPKSAFEILFFFSSVFQSLLSDDRNWVDEICGEMKGTLTCSLSFLQTGLFKLSDEEFFIQPLEKPSHNTSALQAHAIYKRHVSPPSWSPVVQPISGKQALSGTCGVKSKITFFSSNIHTHRHTYTYIHTKCKVTFKSFTIL